MALLAAQAAGDDAAGKFNCRRTMTLLAWLSPSDKRQSALVVLGNFWAIAAAGAKSARTGLPNFPGAIPCAIHAARIRPLPRVIER